MKFENQVQRVRFHEIARWLQEIFGELSAGREDEPVICVECGPFHAVVNVLAWGTDDAAVTTRSYLVMGPEMDVELATYLLKLNDRCRFGAFGLDSDGDVFFEHTICAQSCDKATLRASVRAVLSVAMHYADEIAARWGGRRAGQPSEPVEEPETKAA